MVCNPAACHTCLGFSVGFDCLNEQGMAAVKEGEYAAMEDLWYYDCLLAPKSRPAVWESSESFVEDAAEKGEEKGEEEGKKIDRAVQGMFRFMDEDGDGRVSAEEITRFLEKLQLFVPGKEVEQIVRGVSETGHEFLTKQEFCEFHAILFGGTETEKEKDASYSDDESADVDGSLLQAFRVFDDNGDGFISAAELAQVLCKLGYASAVDEMHCRHMIRFLDRNGDGFIDFDEFKQFMAPVTCVK